MSKVKRSREKQVDVLFSRHCTDYVIVVAVGRVTNPYEFDAWTAMGVPVEVLHRSAASRDDP